MMATLRQCNNNLEMCGMSLIWQSLFSQYYQVLSQHTGKVKTNKCKRADQKVLYTLSQQTLININKAAGENVVSCVRSSEESIGWTKARLRYVVPTQLKVKLVNNQLKMKIVLV